MLKEVRKIGLLLWLAGVSCIGYAQSDTNPSGIEHTNILKIKWGYQTQVDPYLSPLRYSGYEIGIGNEWWQTFQRVATTERDGYIGNWQHVGRIDASGTKGMSSSNSNYLYDLQIQAGWGAYYDWRWNQIGLEVLVGPYLEGEFGARQHASNTNKPYSFDAAVDIEAMAGVAYRFTGQRTSYRLRYLMRINIIGFDWAPDYWQSYYEVTEGVKGKPLCAGPWNRNVLRHELAMDMQLGKTTWRVGAEHELVRYSTGSMDWWRQEVRLVIGCIWIYKTDGGRKL